MMDPTDPPTGERALAHITAPPVLYHYTTSQGLQGILESGSLWATDLRYLNDTNEFRLGRERIIPAFREQVLKEDPSRANEGILAGLIDHALVRNFYVTCFCEDGDLLGQWRGYAAPGGYALGFDTRERTEAVRRTFDYRRVFYDGPMVERLVNGWAKLAAEDYFRAFDSEFRERLNQLSSPDDEFDIDGTAERLYEFSSTYFYRLELFSATIKHQAFSEEREWRILAGIDDIALADRVPKFRQGPLGLTPYLTVDMKREDGRMPLKEVIVGPGSNMDLRVAAVRELLHVLGYESVAVRRSEAPYRG